jgi:ribosome-associated toxin RatA of RatAB toxin-antitoxin module
MRTAIVWPCFLVLAATLSMATEARADDLTRMLEKGPMVRVDLDRNGKFQGVVAVVDVDVPASRMWTVLTDYAGYKDFMPRVEEVDVSRGDDGATLVEWKLRTPLVSTRTVNAMRADPEKMVLRAITVDGDMEGSTFEWRVIPLGDNRCRVIETARHKNMASIVSMLDDRDQTMKMSVALSTTMVAARALKQRAEALERASAP